MDRNPYSPPEAKLDPSIVDAATSAGLSPHTRLYSPPQFFTASFIGSPLAAGGAKGSWWYVVGVGVVCMLAVLALLFLVFFVLQAFGIEM